MHDETETFRREEVARLNSEAGCRQTLEAEYGQVWDTRELGGDFQALGFAAPYVIVKRKVDGVKGTLTFQNSPRFYFDFMEW